MLKLALLLNPFASLQDLLKVGMVPPYFLAIFIQDALILCAHDQNTALREEIDSHFASSDQMLVTNRRPSPFIFPLTLASFALLTLRHTLGVMKPWTKPSQRFPWAL